MRSRVLYTHTPVAGDAVRGLVAKALEWTEGVDHFKRQELTAFVPCLESHHGDDKPARFTVRDDGPRPADPAHPFCAHFWHGNQGFWVGSAGTADEAKAMAQERINEIVRALAVTATPAGQDAPDVIEMRICEVPHLTLKRDTLYRFTVDPNCEGCRSAAGFGATPTERTPQRGGIVSCRCATADQRRLCLDKHNCTVIEALSASAARSGGDADAKDAARYRAIRNGLSDVHGDCYAMTFAADGDYPVVGADLDNRADRMVERAALQPDTTGER